MDLRRLIDAALPMNRKERFFTGTVFPMIVAGAGIEHVRRFFPLIEVEEPPEVISEPESTNLQLFTEYGFRESVFTDEDRQRFEGFERFAKDTPDILIYIAGEAPTLVSVEAKMYDVPTAMELKEQLRRQEDLCDFIGSRIGHPRVVQAALVPSQLADQLGDIGRPVVTWEDLLDTYSDVAPAYWLGVLKEALTRYDELRSRFSPTGSNAETKLKGRILVERYQAGTLEYAWMGRQGGLSGAGINEDIATGAWRDKDYECRSKPITSANWFEVVSFVRRLVEHEGTTVIDTTAG